MTIGIGRMVVKIAGRDSGKKGIIVEILDDKYVLLDGETRRRKCNILHIEPLSQIVKIEKNATHEDVSKALKEIGLEARVTKPKPKIQKPVKKRKTPEQLKAQKEEKKKLRDIFKPKKKEEKEIKETTLEEKAGLIEEKHEYEHKAEHGKELKEQKEKKTAAPKKKE